MLVWIDMVAFASVVSEINVTDRFPKTIKLASLVVCPQPTPTLAQLGMWPTKRLGVRDRIPILIPR
jgi:hypothetical protein